MRALALGLLLAFPMAAAAQSGVSLAFTPESDRYPEATSEYRAIWEKDGARIVEAMESVTGLRFREPAPIRITVYDGVSNSGFFGRPLMLRYSLRSDEKKGTLIHELGHRLIRQVRARPAEVDEHRLLNLFLYDVWVELYGRPFADYMVTVESQRLRDYDYLSAWRWALAMSAEERAATFRNIAGGPPQ